MTKQSKVWMLVIIDLNRPVFSNGRGKYSAESYGGQFHRQQSYEWDGATTRERILREAEKQLGAYYKREVPLRWLLTERHISYTNV